MEALDAIVHDGDGGDGPGRRDLDPLAARRAVGLGVADRRDDDAEPGDALSPDLLLLLQAGEEAADGLAGRVLVGKLGDDVETQHGDGGAHRHSSTSPETRFTASTNSFIMS